MLGLSSAQRGSSLYVPELSPLEAKRLSWGLTVSFEVLPKWDEGSEEEAGAGQAEKLPERTSWNPVQVK